MENLQSGFILRALSKKVTNILSGNLAVFYNLIKNPKSGIRPVFSIGLYKVLADKVQFGLTYISVSFYNQGSQGKQVEFKIGRRNSLCGSIGSIKSGLKGFAPNA